MCPAGPLATRRPGPWQARDRERRWDGARLLVANPLVHPVQLIPGKIHHHQLMTLTSDVSAVAV